MGKEIDDAASVVGNRVFLSLENTGTFQSFYVFTLGLVRILREVSS